MGWSIRRTTTCISPENNVGANDNSAACIGSEVRQAISAVMYDRLFYTFRQISGFPCDKVRLRIQQIEPATAFGQGSIYSDSIRYGH